MGAWGTGTFDNDYARDWVWELEDAGSLSPVEAAILAVNSSGYAGNRGASIALAAAETIAAVAGNPAVNLPSSVRSVVTSVSAPIPPELLVQTRTAVERVLSDSELRELWEETDDFSEWQSGVRDLLGRLA